MDTVTDMLMDDIHIKCGGRERGNEWHANRVKVVCAKFANILQKFSLPKGKKREMGGTTLLLQSKFDR